MGDVHGGVIHHHNKVVKGISDLIERRPAGHHHVATKVGSAPAHGAAHEVCPANFGIIVNTKADHRFAAFRLEGCFLIRLEVAVAIVVARSLLRRLLVLPHSLQFAFAGVAAIRQASVEQGLDGIAVLGDALALNHRLFIPVDSKPLQAFKDVLGVFRLRSFFVGVFDAKQKTAVLVAGKQPIENGGSRGADMKRSRGAGGQTNARHCVEVVLTGPTGFEPATSAVTGRCSNRLNYGPKPKQQLRKSSRSS